jgi:hypothetical protein
MTEFLIKDEDLTSLAGKIVVVTGKSPTINILNRLILTTAKVARQALA